MNILSSHPFFIKREELFNSHFKSFVSRLQDNGYFTALISSSSVIISQTKNSTYNNVVVCYPEKVTGELAVCCFYNTDGFFVPAINQSYSKLSLAGLLMVIESAKIFPLSIVGYGLKNHDRILKEPFCSEILKIFLSSISVFKCPNCGEFTFKYEKWRREDSMFTEERLSHGLNALANVLFLGGHGAGGEWSQATKQRYKYEGFKLTCTNCGHGHKVSTSTLLI